MTQRTVEPERRLSMRIPEALHWRLRIVAAHRQTSAKQVVVDLLETLELP